MNKRDDIIKSAANEEEKLLLIKILDLVDQVKKYYEPRFTDFLDPAEYASAERVLGQFDGISHASLYGDMGFERNMVCIFPDYMEVQAIEPPIVALKLVGNNKFESISHRDILGALMSLGIRREKTGDIILNDGSYYIIVCADISYYISVNLGKVRHTPVKVECIEIPDVPKKQESYKIISANVASLRLDCICSAGYGESRSSAAKEVKSGSVKVNWVEVMDTSYSVSEGDTISLKGRGRIVIDHVGSLTKKGRINIGIKKIL